MTNDFVLDWEKALGFKSDPFADKIPEPVSSYLVNRIDEKEKVNWFFIKGYFFGAIIGEHGVGKTMLLKWLQERLNKYARIHCIYVNAGIFKEQINLVNSMTAPLLSPYEKIWSKPHQNVINFDHVNFLKKKLGARSVALIIDNAHNLTDRNLELIKGLREEGLRIQVIAATTQPDYEKSRLGELGNDELNINLRRLNFEESKELIKKRVEASGGRGFEPFSEDTLKAIYEKADKNPRQFLHLCRDEAIKILIHKKEVNIKHSQDIQPPPKQAQTVAQKKKPESARQELHSRIDDVKPPKKFFNVKFDFKKKDSASMREALSHSRPDDKKSAGLEKYNQDLINHLTGINPKKKHRDSPNDVDKLLKDLSDDMK